jgi:hypothetical protein
MASFISGIGKSLGIGGGDLPFQQQTLGAAQQLGTIGAEATGVEGLLQGRGVNLLDTLTSGQLPAGAEQAVQNQINQSKSTIRARYAALGQTGSTMEADALTQIDNTATAQRFQIAQQMAQLGSQTIQQSLTALGISEQAAGGQANVYSGLMNAQINQDKNTMDVIGNFAKAIGGVAGSAMGGPMGGAIGTGIMGSIFNNPTNVGSATSTAA